jgi:hypothetical protein
VYVAAFAANQQIKVQLQILSNGTLEPQEPQSETEPGAITVGAVDATNVSRFYVRKRIVVGNTSCYIAKSMSIEQNFDATELAISLMLHAPVMAVVTT